MIVFSPQAMCQNDWIEGAAAFRDHNLLQDWAYGEARVHSTSWQVERGFLYKGNRAVGAVQIMIRPLRVVGGGLAWINRGPLWQPRNGAESGDLLVACLQALADHYAVKRRFYLRVAPPVLATAPVVSSILDAGFQNTGTRGWASAICDLSVDETVLRAQLHQKWRNVLNKAERSDIVVRHGHDAQNFDRFLAEYAEFVSARGFATTVTADLIRTLQRKLPPTRRLTVFNATADGASLGSVLIARYGDRAEYLAGTLLDAGRRMGAGQILLWQALLAARQWGCASFDLGGMDPDLTPPGIYRFKDGLGATPYRFCNELEVAPRGPVARLVRWRTARARDVGDERAGS